MVDVAPVVGLVVNSETIFNGLVAGLVYGVLGVGLVLIYRSSRVINFAHGEIGAFCAALLAKLVLDWNWNYYPALFFVLVVGAGWGLLIELTVVRRLFDAPRVILFVATVGVAQLILLANISLPSVESLASFPTPISGSWEVLGVPVRGDHVLAIVVIPVLTLLVTWFLARTRYGMAVRAAASNADAARLAGISPKRMSSIVWTVAGAFAAVSVVLILPLLGLQAGPQVTQVIGVGMLLRALTAALIGRLHSLPVTLAGGLGIGVVEAIILRNQSRDGLLDSPAVVNVVLFVVVLVAVLFQARRSRADDEGTFSFAPRVKPIPANIANLWWVRRLPHLLALAGLAVAVLLPFVIDQPSRQFLWARMLLFAAVALSVIILTGWAGQLSLGQFAFVGLGAFSTAALVGNGLGFVPAVLLGGVFGVVAAVIVGLPALRVRGLYLAITTLAFAVAAEGWLFERSVFVGDATRVQLPRQVVGPLDLAPQRTFYFVCLAFLVVATIAVARLRRGGIGRSRIAVRDNDRSAAAFTISPRRLKLLAFGLAGALASLAGGLFGGLFENVRPSLFSTEASIEVVAIAIIGGIGSVSGAILGALWVIGIPALFGSSQTVRLLTSGLGLLVLLMYLPGGLVQIAYSLRDALFELVSKRRPPVDTSKQAATLPTGGRRHDREARPEVVDGAVALRTDEVSVRFAGTLAVSDVSIEVGQGEVVGLIGANGAGKTTLMNAVGGFVPSRGRVEVLGDDVTTMLPAFRARRGLGRAFQNADLFGDLTVRETALVALEARHRTTLLGSMLGLPGDRRANRARRAEADEILNFVGLGRYADVFVADLSTGTRRICELACLLGLDARLLCLDEPTAGVAQREAEAFGPLIRGIQSELDATVLVIEHDMPLIMSISDRVYCLEAGTIIAEGAPEQVRNDPLVIASYLGTDEAAIARSDSGH